jgi:hypothetical protein
MKLQWGIEHVVELHNSPETGKLPYRHHYTRTSVAIQREHVAEPVLHAIVPKVQTETTCRV